MTSAASLTNTETVNPYPGLRPFEASEANLFFGREKQTRELIERLRQTRFLAVVGSSGSGKSSLVRAGLIPSLQAGSVWRTAVMRPGDKPLQNLALALYSQAQIGRNSIRPDLELGLIETTLRSSSIGLSAAVQNSRLSAAENLLIVVDQFEELFRYRPTDPTAYSDTPDAFIKLLLSAAADPLTPIYIVITLRADFIGSCAPFPNLPKAVSDGQFLVPYLSRQELRRAITEPAALVHCEIAPRLVVRLLNEAGEDPDQLPVLQHALMRSWDYWQTNHTAGEPLDFRHYEAIGTMRSALSQHADEAYSELKSPIQRRIAEQTFRALVETDEQGRITRRPTTIQQVAAIADQPESAVTDVIDHFRQPARAFLVLRPDSFLDLSHESLIRIWTKLKDWAAAEAAAATFYRRLAESAALHRANQQSLWVNPQLALGLEWRDKTKPTPAWADRYAPGLPAALHFLDDSRSASRRRTFWITAAIASIICLLAAVAIVTSVANHQLQKSNDFLTTQIGNLKTGQTTAVTELSALQTAQSALLKDVSTLTAQSTALAAQLKTLHDQSDNLAAQEHSASEDRDSALENLERGIASINDKAHSAAGLAQQNVSLIASVKTATDQNRALMTKVAQLGIKPPPPAATPIFAPSAAMQAELVGASGPQPFQILPDTYLQQLLAQNAKLLAEAQQLSQANQALNQQVAELSAENAKLQSVKADLREQVARLDGEIKLYTAVNDVRSKQIGDLQSSAKSLSADAAKLSTGAQDLDSLTANLHSAINSLTLQQQTLGQINNGLNKAIQSAQPNK